MPQNENADQKELWSTAIHEAGHAVLTWVLGYGASDIDLRPDSDSGNLGASRPINCDLDSLEGVTHEILILYAGAEAQRILGEDEDRIKLGASNDDEKAEYYLNIIGETEEKLRARSAELVREHWTAIERVAKEVIKFIKLNGEVLDLLLSVTDGDMTEGHCKLFCVTATG